MSKPTGDKSKTVNIKISDEVQRGTYANKLIVSHSQDEFILDFVANFPPGPQIVARVVTTPGHAKAICQALAENVRRFEARHGAGGPPQATGPTADA